MRTLVAVLIGLGGLLPVVAAVWAFLIARSRLQTLDRAQAIAAEAGAADVELKRRGEPAVGIGERLEQAGIPKTTWGDSSIMRALLEREIVRGAMAPLKRPGVLALIGVLMGTAGGIWALYLPAS